MAIGEDSENNEVKTDILPAASVGGRKSWTEEDMQRAIEHVRDKKMSFRKAALYFGVPRTTLRRLYAKDGPLSEVVRTKFGRPFGSKVKKRTE